VVVDLHKLWWQPIGASALLVRDPAAFEQIRHPSDYLDRSEDDDEGVLNLVGRSLDTSRRFDALKVLVSLRSTGRRQMAAMVEHVVATTAAAARVIDAHPELELLSPAATVTVLFRWRPADAELTREVLDRANTAIQRKLFATGQAVIGRTRTRTGEVALKLTVVNPRTTPDDLAELARTVVAEGARCRLSAPNDVPEPSGLPPTPDVPEVVS
jgi:L-2,4-diaminobutyrate decarboxylase